jgi:hypothetical protein
MRTEVLQDLDRETRKDVRNRKSRGSQQTTLPVGANIQQSMLLHLYINYSDAKA